MPIGKRNVVKADLCSYPPYILLAEPKFGKTCFWYDLVPKAWGDDSKGLLISFGDEEGYLAYDGIQVEVAKEWNADYDEDTQLRGFIQIVDDIVENNNEYGLKGVCFDTLDTMIDVATKEVLRQHRKEKGAACKSLLDAFGGYGRGKQRLLDLCNTQIDRLRDAGLAVFILCHIKKKEQKDLYSGDTFEQITNNLNADVFTNFAHPAQMVMVGVKEREIVEGKLIAEQRSVYLRGNSFVDAGGRFDNLPEKINGDREYLVDEFLQAFENAVKSSIRHGKNDDKTIATMKKNEEAELAKKAEVAKMKDVQSVDEDAEMTRTQLLEELGKKFTTATADQKKAAKAILAHSGAKKFTDPELSIEDLSNIVALFND